MSDLIDERSKQDFLIYSNSVIKSRAIPSVEDNLKPIHRKILWTLYEDKIFADKPTKKCATEAGRALAYSPHGDASVYGAMVRMSQWWKLRYPLIEMQGNCGNILGDGAAASRYTECRLSPVGMLMLEDINKECVSFKPNYDNSLTEPVTLPSKFPFILCGNNSGIAVGMGSDVVSHNFTEVAEGIKYYMQHKDCTVADLMQYIKGPDFPTGGKIINGEDLLEIYTRGTGAVKVCSHYDITKKGTKTVIIFHDLPYGTEIDDGVKKPLKKLVLDEGYECFENIEVNKAGPHNFDIAITLSKDANVAKCLEILFAKTKLMSSIKINQNFIVDGEPRVLSLKQMVAAWVAYRSNCIQKIAQTDYQKTNHKLTITLGLQKCMSDIDRVIKIVRFDDTPKITLMKEFALNDEQASAVLDIKLSRLSRLEVEKLNQDEKSLENTLAKLRTTIENEEVRYAQIAIELDEIKKVIGKDERLTEIHYARPNTVIAEEALVQKEYKITSNGNYYDESSMPLANETLIGVVKSYSEQNLIGYTAKGELCTLNCGGLTNYIGVFNKNNKNKIVTVTANGNVKISLASDYKLAKPEKGIRVKDDDNVVYMSMCGDTDYLILLDGTANRVLKLAVAQLPIASKVTTGVKSGLTHINAAGIGNDADNLLFVTAEGKGKLTAVKDFTVDSRGNKGQNIAENTKWMRIVDSTRDVFYLVPKIGKITTISCNKVSMKSRTAQGASLTTRAIESIF